MKISAENTDWGIVYYYNDKDYRFALYMYNDDPDSLYLSNVKVNQNMRGQGIGNKILNLVDEEAKKFNVSTIYLKVLEQEWMHDWYGKHGYSDFCYDEEDQNYIWMKKQV